MNWKNPQGSEPTIKREKAREPFLLPGACPDCRLKHRKNVECHKAKLPCSVCGKGLKLGERWQILGQPEIYCANDYVALTRKAA